MLTYDLMEPIIRFFFFFYEKEPIIRFDVTYHQI